MGLRLLRWWVTLLGGLLIGAGLVLRGQIMIAHYIREEVRSVFPLWRAIGNATYFLQGDMNRLGLAMDEVPDHVIAESERIAWVLMILGLLIALAAPWIQPGKVRGKPPRPVQRS